MGGSRFGLVYLAVVLMFLGCVTASQQLLDRPVVEYREMTVPANSLLSAYPVFRFRLSNSNPKTLRLKRISYDLKVNHRKFVKGVSGQNLRIRPADSAMVELELPFGYLDLLEAMRGTERGMADQGGDLRETVRFDLSGGMVIGPFTVPYSVTGSFQVPRLPDVVCRGLRSGAHGSDPEQLMVEIRLSNPNALPLALEHLSYELEVAGLGTVSGEGAVGRSIPAEGELMVALPGSLSAATGAGADGRPSRGYDIEGIMVCAAPERQGVRFPFHGSGLLTDLGPLGD